jgi:hypothetical protein
MFPFIVQIGIIIIIYYMEQIIENALVTQLGNPSPSGTRRFTTSCQWALYTIFTLPIFFRPVLY